MLEEERLALERVAEERFGDFKEECEGVVEERVERLEWRVGEICEGALGSLGEERKRLDELEGELRRREEELRKEKEELRSEKEALRLDKQDLRRDKQEFRTEKEQWREEREALRRKRVPSRCDTRHVDPGRAGSAPV